MNLELMWTLVHLEYQNYLLLDEVPRVKRLKGQKQDRLAGPCLWVDLFKSVDHILVLRIQRQHGVGGLVRVVAGCQFRIVHRISQVQYLFSCLLILALQDVEELFIGLQTYSNAMEFAVVSITQTNGGAVDTTVCARYNVMLLAYLVTAPANKLSTTNPTAVQHY